MGSWGLPLFHLLGSASREAHPDALLPLALVELSTNTAEGHLELEVCSKVIGSQCLWRLALPPMSCVQQHLSWPLVLVDVSCVIRGPEIALSSRNIWVLSFHKGTFYQGV